MNRFTPPTARSMARMAGALALACSAMALAQPPRGPVFPITISDARAEANARFDKLDADRDGGVSRDEFMNAPDTDHEPGAWGPGHGHRIMGEHHQGPRAEAGREAWTAKRESMETELFKRLDKDGSGQLSPEEFRGSAMAEAHQGMMRERMFDRLDKDGNGVLSREEMTAWAERLAAADADGDGTVTREEARTHHQQRRNAGGG